MEQERLTPRDILACPDCRFHLAHAPNLLGACASVGIEYKKSSRTLLFQYMAMFHRHGHENWGD